MKKSYRDLFIWQASVDLAVEVIALTSAFPHRQLVLVDQMVRAAVSVPSNIAEGKGRLSPKELRHYVAIARGSLFELATQLEIATRAGLLPPERRIALQGRMNQIGSGINRFLKQLNSSIAKRRSS